MSENTTNGTFTGIEVPVNNPGGAGLSSTVTLSAKGPSSFSHSFALADLQPETWPLLPWLPGPYEYYHQISGVNPNGLYTFTLAYPTKKSLLTYDYTKYDGTPIPIVDETTFQVTNVTGDPSSPTISWTAIQNYSDVEAYTAAHLYYRLQIRDSNNVVVYSSERQPYTSQTVPPNILQSGQSYQYRVQASDDPGWPVLTKMSNSGWQPLTLIGVPGPPTGVQAAAGDCGSNDGYCALISFTAPADGGSPITYYTVTGSDGTIAGYGTSSPVPVTGLTNGSYYSFTVTATNANGTGQPSAASNVVSPSTTCTSKTAGTWNMNYFMTAPGGFGWWARGQEIVTEDGTYSGSYTDSNGTPAGFSGTLWSFPYGDWPMDNGSSTDSNLLHPDPNLLCNRNPGDTVFVCTTTTTNGAAMMIIGTKQASSYSVPTDLAGKWRANEFDATLSAWFTSLFTIGTSGSWSGTAASSAFKGSQAVGGTLTIDPTTGAITDSSCTPAGICPSSGLSYLDSGKTISVRDGRLRYRRSLHTHGFHQTSLIIRTGQPGRELGTQPIVLERKLDKRKCAGKLEGQFYVHGRRQQRLDGKQKRSVFYFIGRGDNLPQLRLKLVRRHGLDQDCLGRNKRQHYKRLSDLHIY